MGNPYVLYAASNLGSFAALFAYPSIDEPFLTLDMQARFWADGFAILSLLMTALVLLVGRTASVAPHDPHRTDVASPRLIDRLRWIALAAVPSGLVIAVTAYLTTDIAAAPFLWVIPLALYLLTFAVFRDRPWIAHATVVRMAPLLVAPLVISIGGDKVFWAVVIALNLATFVLLALLCHGEIYARRPEPGRLTEFFLCTSLGGVVGGVFAAGLRRSILEISPWLAASLALGTLWYVTRVRLPGTLSLPFLVLMVCLALAMLLQRHRPLRFFGLVVTSLVLTAYWRPGMAPIESARSFFGVHRVVQTADGTARIPVALCA
jgi:hypothetical protein